MKRFIRTITILLAIVPCLRASADDLLLQRIGRIENGLVELASPMELFQTSPVNNAVFKTLAERMKNYLTPGVSLAVIDHFELDWAKSYGVLKAGSNQPVAVDSYFEAASTSKLVTAAIVLHYVDTGRLNLDEDINTYLKSWKFPENDFTRQRKVTLRLLLTHQAGLPATHFTQKENEADPTLDQILKGESPAMNKPAVAEIPPDTKWQYSNMGYVVIQKILEDSIGKSFAQIAQETVFVPLGMNHSTFNYPLDQKLQANEAWPHDGEGILRNPEMVTHAQAQGGLMTTPSDLAAFTIELMQAYNGRSARLFSRETARLMFTKQTDLDPAMFGFPIADGLGAFLYGEGENLVFLHPGGNKPGMNCMLIGYPKSGRGVVVMTNGDKGELLFFEIIGAINREYGKN
ncbi:MAG: serine hydrolase domain-containing protein [Candidatus Aminicenantales bacterium]